jgi:DNA polymerase (family 10)
MAKTTGHKRIATAQRDKRKSVYGRSSVNNAKIAALLRQYAAVLSVQGESRFKVKAFRRAAETVESTIENLAEQVAQGADLRELPAIGSGIAAVIQEIVQSGGLPKLDQAMEQLPPELLELATKPQLNPQKILRVYKKFGIRSLNQLTKRLDSGEIGKAFGTRLEFQLRHALDSRPRHLLWAVQKLTPAIEAYLREHCGVDRLEPVGSLRRRQDTVADIGYLVTGTSAPQIFKRFANFGAVEAPAKVKGRRASFQLAGNRTVTLVYSQTADWGLNLLLETGSGSHLKELQSQAAKSKLSLAKRSLGKKAVDEATIYGGLGLDFVPPELREGRGEVQAALERALPQLITLEDLKGDLHMHTTASDGANSIEEMATAAAARGYQYIAITDHSQSLKIRASRCSNPLKWTFWKTVDWIIPIRCCASWT